MITWFIVLPITVAVLTVAFSVWRGRQVHRHCPSCEVDYELVAAAGQGPNQTYDVLACPFCTNTVTRTQGVPSSIAWCPACRNRSLVTSSTRVPGDGLQVEVHEHCQLCEFDRAFLVGDGDIRPMGQVIPFPLERARQRRAEEAAEKAERQG